MERTTTDERYGAWVIAMHWLMLALLVGVYASIELRELYPRGSAIREALKTWHYMLGLAVFGLLFVRLALRLVGGSPRIEPPPPAWTQYLATAMHLALYAFMFAMPLLGWLSLSADGKSVAYLGLQLPALIGPDQGLAERFEELHETVGTLGYYLVGLHAAAALFHHYFIRDNTLLRMLPRHGRG